MRHLFGYGGASRTPIYDPRAACLEKCRKDGLSEYEAYRRWVNEVKPALEGAK